MKKLLLLLIIPFLSFGQSNLKRCGVKSSYLSQQRAKHIKVTNFNVITVPVHFIIVHKPNEDIGTGRNLSEEQIYSQIEVLNEDFRKLNPSSINTPEEFMPVAADCMIEFCLATIDPSGNPTTGITRYSYDSNQMSESYWENTIAPDTYWDSNYYLNIWTARLGGGNDGFAYMPSDGVPPYLDGVVVKDRYVGRYGSAQLPFNEGHLTTHEVGHWFGVDHTWDAWDDYSCNIDDGIDDTPEQYEEYYDTPTYPQYSCETSDMFMNFMDYVDDAALTLWTEGQKELMHEVIINYRSELLDNPYGCNNSNSIESLNNSKTLVNTIDLLGRSIYNNGGLQLHIYDDGSIEKKYLIK